MDTFDIRKFITESKRNDTYFKTASQAASYARKTAEDRGYEVDEDEWQTQIAMGGKYGRLRPSEGKTHSFSVSLLRDGKPQKKSLQISLFGMPSGSYELNHYIS